MSDDTLIQQVKEQGALNAGVVPVSEIAFDLIFRQMCEQNSCGNYGKCWMCPPDAGDAKELIAEAKSFDKILVYQTVGTLEDSFDFEGMMDAAAKHNALAGKLSELFAGLPFEKKLHLGAGGCHVCEICAKRTGEPCRFPDRAMPSLETYCIHVSNLAASAGMKYINGKDTVTYFGALLFTEKNDTI